MSERDNLFDDIIRKAAEDFELKSDASAWSNVASKLDSPKSTLSLMKKVWISISVGAVAALAIYGFNQVNEPIKVENPVEPQTVLLESSSKSDQKTEEVTINTESVSDDSIEDQKIEEQREQGTVIKNAPDKVANEAIENQKAVAQNEQKPIKRQPKSTPNATPKISTSEILVSKYSVCASEIVELTAGDPSLEGQFLWKLGDGHEARSKTVKHQFKQTGVYEVSLKVKRPNGVVEELTETITVNPKPTATIDYETTDFHCHNSSICFNAPDENLNAKYTWNFGDNNMSNEANPKHTFHKKGHYNVKLIARNDYGCADSSIKRVYVMRAFNLMAAPNFSPNGDGNNDQWMPLALQKANQEFTLRVMNTMGELVYTTTNYNQPWTGNLASGQQAKAGEMYVWIAVVKDSTGRTNEYGGSIVITE